MALTAVDYNKIERYKRLANTASSAFNTAGQTMVNVGTQMKIKDIQYEQQEKQRLQNEKEALVDSDSRYVGQYAEVKFNEWKSNLINSGNYTNYEEEFNKYVEGLDNSLKNDPNLNGKGDAIDKWLTDNKANFVLLAREQFNSDVKVANQALNKAQVSSIGTMMANTPSSTNETVLKAMQAQYKAELDPSGQNNPSNPENRLSYATTLFQTNTKALAELNFGEGIEVTENGITYNKMMNEDDFVDYAMKAFDSDILDDVMEGFNTEGYKGKPYALDEEVTRKYLEETIRADMEEYLHNAYQEKEAVYEKKVKATAGAVNNTIALNQANGISTSVEEAKKAYADAFNITEDEMMQNPYITDQLASTLPEFRNAQTSYENKRFNDLKSFVNAEVTDIYTAFETKMNDIATNGIDNLQQTIYTANGTQEVTLDDDVPKEVSITLADEFIKANGDSVGIISLYSDEIDRICEKYEITDPTEKMVIANSVNQLMDSYYRKNGGYGSTTGAGKEEEISPAVAFFKSLLYNNPKVDPSRWEDLADTWYLNGQMKLDDYNTVKNTLKNANSPYERKAKYIINAIDANLGAMEEKNRNSVKFLMGYENFKSDGVYTYLLNHPNATQEEMDEFATSVTQKVFTAATYKDVGDVVSKALYADLTADGILDGDYNNFDEIIASYKNGECLIIQRNPEKMARIKQALKLHTGTWSLSDFQDYVAQEFFKDKYGEHVKFNDLTKFEKKMMMQPMCVATYELSLYNDVKTIADSFYVDGKEIRFDDNTVGYMNKSGVVFKSAGSRGAVTMGVVSRTSDEYKSIFSESYDENAPYSGRAYTMVSMRGVQWYEGDYRSLIKDKKQSNTRQVGGYLTGGTTQTYEVPLAENVIKYKPISELTVDDYKEDENLIRIYHELLKRQGDYYAGNISGYSNQTKPVQVNLQ